MGVRLCFGGTLALHQVEIELHKIHPKRKTGDVVWGVIDLHGASYSGTIGTAPIYMRILLLKCLAENWFHLRVPDAAFGYKNGPA